MKIFQIFGHLLYISDRKFEKFSFWRWIVKEIQQYINLIELEIAKLVFSKHICYVKKAPRGLSSTFDMHLDDSLFFWMVCGSTGLQMEKCQKGAIYVHDGPCRTLWMSNLRFKILKVSNITICVYIHKCISNTKVIFCECYHTGHYPLGNSDPKFPKFEFYECRG